MAPVDVETVRRQIDLEREQLAAALDALRKEMDINAKLRPRLLLAAAASLAAGFVLAGGIGATVRLVFRRGRED